MIRSTIASVLLLFALTVEAAPRRRAAAVPEPVLAAIDAIGRKAVEDGIPGVSIAVRRGNELWYVKGYGVMNRDTRAPARADTVFQLGSVGKQFTGAAVLRLAERGALALTDKMRAYIPELDARFDTITIEHLLTHTSGLVNYNELLTTAYEAKSRQEMIQLIGSRPLRFAPGTNAEYNNSGYYLAAIIIERVSGKTYAHFLRDEFFLPLGLTQTDHCGYSPAFPTPDGYLRLSDRSIVFVVAADMSLLLGAGSICSSPRDLLSWTVALTSGSVVSSASLDKMTTTYRLANGIPIGYGYGLILDRLDGHRRWWHNGAVLGFTTHAAHFPDDDVSVVVLTNLVDLEAYVVEPIADTAARAILPP